jgi:hypothetical protein
MPLGMRLTGTAVLFTIESDHIGETAMENLIAGDLRIEALGMDSRAPIRLMWNGKSNDRHPAKVLSPYFVSVLSAAVSRDVPVELHFEKLEHFNSSTVTSIIQLIQDCREQHIKLVIVYDHSLKWQKLSFDALRVFSRDELLELRTA